jgi:DNA/RNA-binding domain of Phe-tRNA-synthetase-like protein
MIDIQISDSIKRVLPDIRLGCIQAKVGIVPSSRELLSYIDQMIEERKNRLTIEEVSKIIVIADTKGAYRKLGKDPSRYRPSAEALIRRIVQGKGLYRVNNIVDALNIISIKHGFSIGGYDVEKIDGMVTLGVGGAGEPYEAIGRGLLNIEDLPVLRDARGVFGSPTSDSLRTMIKDSTTSFLMVFFDFRKSELLEAALRDAENVLKRYCTAKKVELSVLN